jgi:D-threonate/D-erythronate kinase
MSPRLAIIADDLTGALDSSVPFVLAGLTVLVALTPAGLDEALAGEPGVVVVNTASRAVPPERAAAIAGEVATRLLAAAPAIVFKKIDSRLKGNAGVETGRVANVMGRTGIVVAPAVPDQQRFVRDGCVEGRGIDGRLAIAPAFTGLNLPVLVADAMNQGDLDRLVASTDWTTHLAVGARGLGQSLARHLGGNANGVAFERRHRTLFAFGSRDPITEAQMDLLVAAGGVSSVLEAPAGLLTSVGPVDLPALLRCTGPLTLDATAVAEQFGEGVAQLVDQVPPEMLIMGGGDTALAILIRLDVRVVTPRGEIEPGMPWFEVTDSQGNSLVCAVKSGGFGAPDSLLKLTTPRAGSDAGRLIEENHRAQR